MRHIYSYSVRTPQFENSPIKWSTDDKDEFIRYSSARWKFGIMYSWKHVAIL